MPVGVPGVNPQSTHVQDSGHISFFVRPQGGYRESLVPKFEGMRTLARAKRLLERSNQRVPGNLRNEIWSMLMVVAAGSAAPLCVFRSLRTGTDVEVPERVHVVFHRKRIQTSLKNLMRSKTKDLGRMAGQRADEYGRRSRGRIAALMLAFARAVAVDRSAVTVDWASDQRLDRNGNTNRHAGALWLAHSLARHVHRDLRKQGRVPGMIAELERAGYSGLVEDFTSRLVAPLARESVERWQQATGYPLPRGIPVDDPQPESKVWVP
jgi:hypothetical protein